MKSPYCFDKSPHIFDQSSFCLHILTANHQARNAFCISAHFFWLICILIKLQTWKRHFSVSSFIIHKLKVISYTNSITEFYYNPKYVFHVHSLSKIMKNTCKQIYLYIFYICKLGRKKVGGEVESVSRLMIGCHHM